MIAWWSLDKKKNIALSDNDYSLLVEEVNGVKDDFNVVFDCEGILGCYKLSRCIYFELIYYP